MGFKPVLLKKEEALSSRGFEDRFRDRLAFAICFILHLINQLS
jgi:hypothetical protein